MSSFLCSVRHINALATFAKLECVKVRLNDGSTLNAQANPQRVADILLAGNLAGLRAAYPADDDFGPEYAIEWTHATAADTEAGVIFKQVECLNYQAGDAEDYDASDCAAVLREIMKAAVSHLHGYESAPWGLDGDEPLPKVTKLQPAPGKATQGDLMAMLFPAGPVSLDDVADATEAQPVTATPTKPAKPAPTPAPRKAPTTPARPADDEQADGPF